MADLNNGGSDNSSTSGNNPLRDSPFGRLSEVLSDEQLTNLFSGVGNGEGGGSPIGGGGGGSQPDLPYGGNPFAGDNFWNIFAGGVNPSAGGGNPGSGRDPLTGAGSQTGTISTTEIPDGFSLRVTIDKLIESRLDKELGGEQIPSFGGSGQIPSFGGSGQIPSFGGSGQIPSFGGSGQIPSFGGGGQIPSFGGGGQIPSFGGGGQIPSFGG
ncbi:hypothetical protein [Nostoc sp. NZL]|uniref:hypothetical protein n=1 Tax=Nostoc sp. NZL TaxID=2650612 RepID=UPI0018C6955F|nr:hypothetical protein [Nostoc sp. NZL]MBG1243262.1 hypothetical protein [Nostoc sp. NZL]